MDTSFASVLVLHTLPVRLVFIHSISLISVVVIDQDFMPLSRNSYLAIIKKKFFCYYELKLQVRLDVLSLIYRIVSMLWGGS